VGREEYARLAAERLRATVPGQRGSELADEMVRLLAGGEADVETSPTAAGSLAAMRQERELRFRAWIESLSLLADDRPQLWLLEDVHWAGGDLLALIEQLGRQPSPQGRLVLATARPTLLEQVIDREPGTLPGGTLELPPLESADARQLVIALVGDALPEALVETVVESSDGNPLFIEELLRAWVSLGTLFAAEDGTWQLSADVGSVTVPQTVQQIYAAQLDDLPTDARALVRRASVAGRHVPTLSLETLDVPGAEAAVSTARRRGLLEESPPDVVAGPLLGYRHALLRDAGYASLARAERARLHARLAGWYRTMAGQLADEVAAQIAGHYGAAVDHASRLSPEIDRGLDVDGARALAIEWCERAARRALAGADHEAARSLLRRALDHADDSEPLVRARLLLALGEATAYTADMQQGGRLISEAVDLYRRLLDARPVGSDTLPATADDAVLRAGYAAACAALARVWIQQVRFDDAQRLANEALGLLGDGDDPAIAPLLGIRSWVRATLSMDPSAMADVDRALDITRRAGDRHLELELRDWRASALGELDEFAVEDWTAIHTLALELGNWRLAVKAMRMEAGAYVDDQHDRVWTLADEAAEIATRRGQDEDVCWIDYLRSEAGFVSGDWERALAAGRRVLDLGERNSYDRAVVRTLHVLLPIATARADQGLIERAFRWHEARKGTFPDSPYARIMEAAIELHCSAAGLQPRPVPSVAPRLASFGGEPGGPSWLAALETVLERWLEAGDLPSADEAVSRMEAGVRNAPTTSALGRGTTAYLRARVLAAGSASPADVASVARQSLEHFRVARAPWWIAKSLRQLRGIGVATAAEQEELAEIVRRLRLAGD
jgi:tetratricopeptide (TPR) repeat protein